MPRLLLAGLAVAAIACGGPSGPAGERSPASTAPPDWVTVSSSDGSIQMTLPPWLGVGDNVGAIFANEPPPGPGEEIPMQLMALGPRDERQPAPGQDLVAWIGSRLVDPGQGVPTVSHVGLPAGPAVRYERTDRADTPMAWRFLVFAIETPAGVAYLQLDGPPDSWPERLEDLERIPLLLGFR